MTKGQKTAAVVIGAGLAYVAYRSYSGVKNAVANLQYDFGGFSLDKKKTTLLNGLVGMLTFRITNNRDTSIPLKSFVGELKYNDKVIANLRTKPGDITLRANSTSNVNVGVQIKPLNLLSLGGNFLLSLIGGKKPNLKQPLVVTGQLATSVVTLPVNESFEIL